MALWFWSVLIIGTAVGLAVGGMLLVRRSTTLEFLESHNEVAGFIYAVVGVVYAVLLAFVVTFVWERFERAETIVGQETSKLRDLFRDSQTFPEAFGNQVQEQLRRYVELVIEKEWPAMARGEASPEAREAFDGLWQTYRQLEPRDARENAWYSVSVEHLNDIGEQRRLRLLSSRSTTPKVMWAVLLVGGIIAVTFSYFFGTKNVWPQTLMVAALSCVVALILLLILVLDHPFGGFVRVPPEAFQELLEVLGR